jgi:ribosomal protein L7/L12
MKISVNYEFNQYDVSVTAASKELAKALTECASEYMFTGNSTTPNVGTVSEITIGLADKSDTNVVKGFITLIKAYHGIDSNKINCIRLLRTVTRWGLKDSKDLVDFAIGATAYPHTSYPDWITNAKSDNDSPF